MKGPCLRAPTQREGGRSNVETIEGKKMVELHRDESKLPLRGKRLWHAQARRSFPHETDSLSRRVYLSRCGHDRRLLAERHRSLRCHIRRLFGRLLGGSRLKRRRIRRVVC